MDISMGFVSGLIVGFARGVMGVVKQKRTDETFEFDSKYFALTVALAGICGAAINVLYPASDVEALAGAWVSTDVVIAIAKILGWKQ